MIVSGKTPPRQILLNEIVSTLEFIDYLKYESRQPVKSILEREERKKNKLIERFRTLH